MVVVLPTVRFLHARRVGDIAKAIPAREAGRGDRVGIAWGNRRASSSRLQNIEMNDVKVCVKAF